MSGELIRIEVVAAVHNRKEITLLCLKSLSRIDSSGLDVHCVIVDDGSTDGTSDAIRSQFPDVEVVQGDGTLWYTEGTNVAIRAALEHNPKYLLLINDDQVFDQDFLLHLVETAEKHPRSIVGPLLLLWDRPHLLFQTSPIWNTWRGGWVHWHDQTIWTIPEKPWKVDLIVGNCVLVPAEALRRHGLMRSDRYPNFGDAELTPRLKNFGFELIIDPRSRVFCQPNTLPPRIRKMGFKQLYNDLFRDLGASHNLRRRLYGYLDGAPTKAHGFAAFGMFLLRAGTGLIFSKKSETEQKSSKPLRERFADAVINE